MIQISLPSLFRYIILLLFAIGLLGGKSLSASPCGSFISNLNQRIELSEGWQFRKGDNMDWKEAQVEETFWISRNIPDYGISKTENISGYHWYRCKLNLPENFESPRNPLGINLGMIRDIDEVYFNGNLIGKTGSFVPNLEADFQKVRIYSIPTKLLIAGENVIAIRINSIGNQQGLKSIPVIFDEAKLIQKMYSSESIPIGFGYIFILMGLYFLTGAFIRGLRSENIFFGLFSIHIGLYTLIRTQYRYEMFESFTYSYIFELMVLIPLPALFINFLIFHLDSKRNILVIAFEVFLTILFFTVPFTKTSVGWNIIITAFNYGLPIAFGIVVFYIARSFKVNLPKLRFILIGLLGLLPTIIIDSLTALEIISINGTIYFGFFFFLILISVQLSEEMVSSLEKYLAMESELIQMEKIKTGFLLNISNEFKTGIEKITSSLVKLKSTKKSTNKKELPPTQVLDFQIRNTISMIDEAILLSNLEDKKYIKNLNPFDPKQIIDECVQLSELRLDQKRKNLHITIPPSNSVFHIDVTLFRAIARNLIENAFLYTDKSVRIDIEFEFFSNKFTFTVADEGLGMNHFEQENLFKKFIRGESKNTIPGAGIGLTLVHAAVKELGGDIKVKSSEGMGAMFVATIPFVPITPHHEITPKKLGRKKVL